MIFRKQYYLRAMVTGPESFAASFDSVQMCLYTDESFTDDAPGVPLERENRRWMFSIGGMPASTPDLAFSWSTSARQQCDWFESTPGTQELQAL